MSGDCDRCGTYDHVEADCPDLMQDYVSKWVWCPEVFCVLVNDPCAMAYEHPADCECGNRYPLTVDREATS